MTTDGESDKMNQIYAVHIELVILKESVCRLALSYLSVLNKRCISLRKIDIVGPILKWNY